MCIVVYDTRCHILKHVIKGNISFIYFLKKICHVFEENVFEIVKGFNWLDEVTKKNINNQKLHGVCFDIFSEPPAHISPDPTFIKKNYYKNICISI